MQEQGVTIHPYLGLGHKVGAISILEPQGYGTMVTATTATAATPLASRYAMY